MASAAKPSNGHAGGEHCGLAARFVERLDGFASLAMTDAALVEAYPPIFEKSATVCTEYGISFTSYPCSAISRPTNKSSAGRFSIIS